MDEPRSPSTRVTVTDQAISRLIGLIRAGQLQRGERIPTERALAEELGVSRSSVREAIRALSAMGVLEPRQGDGTYVTQLAPTDILETLGLFAEVSGPTAAAELLELRRILESAATAMTAARASDQQLELIGRTLDDARRCSGNVEAMVAADVAFHAAISRACGNAMLAAVIEGLSSRTLRTRVWRGLVDKTALAKMYDEHERIYAALRCRDPNAASAAAATHVAGVEQWLCDRGDADDLAHRLV
ncbi:FadR/GntR family transcriptional regulator [Streptomyces tubercidicus]